MITIRDAKVEDAEKIAELNINARIKAYKDLMPPEITAQEIVTIERIEKWKKRADDENQIFFLVEENNKILGILWGEKNSDNKIPYPYEVHALYVDINEQQKGIGSILINEFRKRINNSAFFLYMLKGNSSSAFYKKLGGIELPDFAKTDDVRGWNAPLVMFMFK